MDNQISRGIKIANKMISDSQKILEKAINTEDWYKASDMSSYIVGMKQIVVIFELLEKELV